MINIENLINLCEQTIEKGTPIGTEAMSYHFWFDLVEVLKEKQEERERILSWLSKFCRHIDNGEKWSTDAENYAFFRKKLHDQFGWFGE